MLPLSSLKDLCSNSVVPGEVATSRIIASRVIAPEVEFPKEKRTMAGRSAVPVAPVGEGKPTELYFETNGVFEGGLTLRLTSAVDERVLHRISVGLSDGGGRFGLMEVLFASPGQVFEFKLDEEQSRLALKHGLSLSVEEGSMPFWFVVEGKNATEYNLPQLYRDEGKATLKNFLSLFCSSASFQPYDWMGVCVADGLNDWAKLGREDAAATLKQYFKTFIDPETGQRENIKGHPADEEPGGPESTGPYAVLAELYPDHPALSLAEEGFRIHYNPVSDAVGPQNIVTESCYNIAYPMMALACYSGKEHYKERALQQLSASIHYLSEEDDLYLRCNPETKERTFKNWSRGVAWYFLGFVRTLALLPRGERPEPLLKELERVSRWVEKHQLETGLWPCYLKENDILPDTSGCAGIAAAIAIAIKEGMISRSFLPIAEKVYTGLMEQMTHDGWLRGTSQSNKRETHYMDIQRVPFRVIAPWGMGMFAQLAAALVSLKEDILD